MPTLTDVRVEAIKAAAHSLQSESVGTATIINRALFFEEYILTGNNRAERA